MTLSAFSRLLLSLLLCLFAHPLAAQSYDFDELCGLDMDEGRLIVEVRPPQVNFGGFRGRGFDVGGIRGSATGTNRRGLSITCTHSYGPSGADGTLGISSQPFGIRIQHSIAGAQSHDVYFEQVDNRAGASEDSFALLRVTFQNSARKIELRAPDFGTLCQEYPREASLYLGPIFRVLKRGHLFSVEPRFARQVLGAPPAADELKPQVRSLVAKLDSDSPRDRAGASAILLELGLKANEQLETLDRATLTPQQHAEVEAILHNSYAPTAVQREAIRKDAQFMVDCLYVPDPKVRELALERLRQLNDKPVTVELPEDRNELRRAIEKLRDSLSLKR